MDIKQEDFDHVQRMVVSWQSKKPTYELEARLVKPCDKDRFSKIIQYCQSLTNAFSEETSLDISCQYNEVNYRISLNHIENIQKYCQNGTIKDGDNVTIMSKENISDMMLPDYIGFKVNLKAENIVKPESSLFQNILENLAPLKKMFRLKKRYSYIASNGKYRFDCTIVKSSDKKYVRFSESISKTQPQTYEVEIEVLHGDKTTNAKQITQGFFENMCILNVLAFGNDQIGVKVRSQYLKFCFGENVKMEEAIIKPGSFFFGPQPITLERKNIIPSDLGVMTILDDYTVTDKADGNRTLLFINSEGRAYFINNLLEVRDMDVQLDKLKNTLLDGEYITRDINNTRDINLYAVFDIYFLNGEATSAMPLMDIDENIKDTRYHKMKEFESLFKTEATSKKNKINVKLKKFLSASGKASIFKQSAKLYDARLKGDYHIDGLIYTPMKLAVGGNFPGDKPTNTGTWINVFKWKPPEENTIDFLVRFDPTIKHGEYPIVTLYVGHDPMQSKRLDAITFFNDKFSKKEDYQPTVFIPEGDVVLRDSPNSKYIGELICERGDVIENDSIVEFKYLKDEGKWKPLRVREDKTNGYRKNGIAKTANDINTANNIWRSIHNPVTDQHITGKVSVDVAELQKNNDVYYSRPIARDKMASQSMMIFHNFVKNELLSVGGATLLDLACGKAGDLNKWISHKYTKVVGIDKSSDNIENSKDGAYARTLNYYKGKNYAKNRYNFLYLTMDCGHVINKEYVNMLDEGPNKEVAKFVFGISDIGNDKMKHFKGVMTDKFDVVSSQFAIHYFFESDVVLDAFVENVDKFLKVGGYFIGTCLDGQIVKKALQGKSQVEGVKGERVLWNIRKQYQNDNPDMVAIGEKIEVYMESIGQRLPEYLVNIKLLKSKLKAKNIVLRDIRRFDSYNSTFSEKNKMDPSESAYSNMNITFKFQKEEGVKKEEAKTITLKTPKPSSSSSKKEKTPTPSTNKEDTPEPSITPPKKKIEVVLKKSKQ